MKPEDTMWGAQAQALVEEYGYIEAKRRTIKARNDSSEGTASFAFHNAVLKELHKFATVGRLS